MFLNIHKTAVRPHLKYASNVYGKIKNVSNLVTDPRYCDEETPNSNSHMTARRRYKVKKAVLSSSVRYLKTTTDYCITEQGSNPHKQREKL